MIFIILILWFSLIFSFYFYHNFFRTFQNNDLNGTLPSEIASIPTLVNLFVNNL